MSTSWMSAAKCIGMNTDDFFPPKGSNVPREVVAACGTCPVRQECQDYATEHRLKGIWGGMSGNARMVGSDSHSDVCRNGHPRTPENTKVGSTGRIRCRECLVASSKRAYAVRKAKMAAEHAA